ncbi:MAG: hypothetical protein DRH93_17040 [Deltaproteobacteria bacterium]|nr:MAG: hypothetical protein DRH93_17040 [Deltaproteobacteria bacterium]
MEGQCHFLEGNTHAKSRIEYIKTLLPAVHIDPARVEMFNLSAAMGPRWAEICIEFTNRIKEMGPSPVWFARRKMAGKE